ncbi:hypothetical protein AVEN_212365-1 [Araneus ventricosus]|uniref:Uncharacterized protein n=1 Tax=Araneus ventricosus TaxID=182803 RepID=A0A4Y2RDC8_ARAVE|nr:hypothetical protein AVEN_212365-1 [Araneus ventricosus]
MTRTTPQLAHPLQTFRIYKYCLYHFIVSNKRWGGSLPAGLRLALQPSWVGQASVGIFAPHRREDVWHPTYVLARNKPNTRRIFGGIGFRT